MRLYEQAITLAGTGIPVGTLQNWVQRDLVELDSVETESEARRRRRRYSERDVVRLALMAELVELGFSPSAAGDIVNRETLRPLGFLPEWMGHTETDHFLVHGNIRTNEPLIPKRGSYVVRSPAELAEVMTGVGRKETDAQKPIRNAVVVNLSYLVRAVRERMLDAFAAGHVADEADEAGSGAPGDE